MLHSQNREKIMKKQKNTLNVLFNNIPQGKRELFYRMAEKVGWSKERVKEVLKDEREGRLHN